MNIRSILLFTFIFACGCACLHYAQQQPSGRMGWCGDGPFFCRYQDQWFEKQCDCGYAQESCALTWHNPLRVTCSACGKAFAPCAEAYVLKKFDDTDGAIGYSGHFSSNDKRPR